MPAFLDDPPANSVVDPLCIFVRGWIWLREKQGEIVSIEAECGELRIGATRVLYPRPDVTAAHQLRAWLLWTGIAGGGTRLARGGDQGFGLRRTRARQPAAPAGGRRPAALQRRRIRCGPLHRGARAHRESAWVSCRGQPGGAAATD